MEADVYFLEKPDKSTIARIRDIRFTYFLDDRMIPNLKTILKILVLGQYDIIHVNLSIYGFVALLSNMMRHTPFIMTFHGTPEPSLQTRSLNKIAYAVESISILVYGRRASYLTTVSQYTKDRIALRYGISPTVVHNGIDISVMEPINALNPSPFYNLKTISRTEQNSKSPVNIIFVGTLNAYKDPLTLVKAVSKVIEVYSDVQLRIVGNGELYKDVNKLINDNRITDNVKILPHLDNGLLYQLYRESDVLVLPSIGEAFGIVLLEAMAFGLAIIASDSGACPEILGKSGLLFKVRDHDDLAQKIIRVINDRELLYRLKRSSVERVRLFSSSDSVRRYVEIYMKLRKEQYAIHT